MVTSTAFAQAVPAWASLFADGAAVKRAFGAGLAAARRGLAGVARGDARRPGGRGRLPRAGHRVSRTARRRSRRCARRPGGDRLLFELARAAATHAAETAAGRPVLLALSLSSNDYVDHVFGPDSWEAWDELRRLDRGLAELLAALDALVGPSGYAVMLTGDHGSGPLPEISRTRTGALVPARGRRPLAAAVRPRRPHHRRRHRAPAGRGADHRRRRGGSVRLPDPPGQGAAARRTRGAAPADRCAVRRARRDRAGDRHPDRARELPAGVGRVAARADLPVAPPRSGGRLLSGAGARGFLRSGSRRRPGQQPRLAVSVRSRRSAASSAPRPRACRRAYAPSRRRTPPSRAPPRRCSPSPSRPRSPAPTRPT